MTCSLDERPIDATSILDRLKRLSSAEDFFSALGVAYDEAVLRVARLHILKRMGQYLKSIVPRGLAPLDRRGARQGDAATRLCRFRTLLPARRARIPCAEEPRSEPAGPPKTAFVGLDEIAPLPPRQ